MRAVLFVLLFLSFAGQIARADFDAGTRAFDAGDYATAIKEWQPAAEGGDVAAMRNLGQIYRLGLGVEKDPVQAIKWYKRAAEIGFDRAQANLGAMYLEGYGVDRDFAEAAHWFDRAARQGHVLAQYNLGLMYENGLGVSRDPARALGWYNLAARQGHPEALQKLSHLVQEAPPATPPAKTNNSESADAAAAQPATVPAATPTSPPVAPAVAPVPPPVSPSAPVPQPATTPADTASDDSGPKPVEFDLFGMISKFVKEQQAKSAKAPAPAKRDALPPPASVAVIATPAEPDPAGGTPTQLIPPPKDEVAPSDPLEEGSAEYDQQNYRRALGHWLPLANDGNSRAQFLVGRLYYNGEGLVRDRTRAFMWWMLAARQDDAEARAALERVTAELNESQLADGRTLVENFRPRRN